LRSYKNSPNRCGPPALNIIFVSPLDRETLRRHGQGHVFGLCTPDERFAVFFR
jgi:hypothetical protein